MCITVPFCLLSIVCSQRIQVESSFQFSAAISDSQIRIIGSGKLGEENIQLTDLNSQYRGQLCSRIMLYACETHSGKGF